MIPETAATSPATAGNRKLFAWRGFWFVPFLPAMTDERPTAEASPPQPDQPAAPTRSARLLTLVRKLIDFGKDLLTTLQTPVTTVLVSRRFGNIKVEMILARIRHALDLAVGLEERVIKSARSLDRVRPPPEAKPDRPAAPAAPAPPQPRLPTAEQILRRMRGKSIGAVLAEICRDFEIINGDKLWLPLIEAVCTNRGPTMRMLRNMQQRVRRTGYYVPDPPGSPPPTIFVGPSLAFGTGPP